MTENFVLCFFGDHFGDQSQFVVAYLSVKLLILLGSQERSGFQHSCKKSHRFRQFDLLFHFAFLWRQPPWPEISGPSLFLSPIQDWRSLCPMDISVSLRPRRTPEPKTAAVQPITIAHRFQPGLAGVQMQHSGTVPTKQSRRHFCQRPLSPSLLIASTQTNESNPAAKGCRKSS